MISLAEEMLEMASLGAKVMQPVSIQDARLNRIDIEVKSSFIKKPGTLITKDLILLIIKLLQEFHPLKMTQRFH